MSPEDENDDVDIYGDLPDFSLEGSIQKLEAENKALTLKVKDLTARVAELEIENNNLNRLVTNVKANISSLLNTAKAEVGRKDSTITELRQEREDLFFRRKNPNRRGRRAQPSERNQDAGPEIDKPGNLDDRNNADEAVLSRKRSTRHNALSSKDLSRRKEETANTDIQSSSTTKSPCVPDAEDPIQGGSTKQISSPISEKAKNIPSGSPRVSSRSTRSRKLTEEMSEPAKTVSVYRLTPLKHQKKSEKVSQGKRSRRALSSTPEQSTKQDSSGDVSDVKEQVAASDVSAKLKVMLSDDVKEPSEKSASAETQIKSASPPRLQVKLDTSEQSKSISPKKRMRRTPTSRLYVKTRSSARLSAKLQNSVQDSSNDGGTDVSLLEALQLEEKSQPAFTNSPMPAKLSPLQDNDKSLSPLPQLPAESVVVTPLPSSTPVSNISSLLTGLLKLKQSATSSNEPGPRTQLAVSVPRQLSPSSMPKDPRKLPSASASEKLQKVLSLGVISYKDETTREKEPSSKESLPLPEVVKRKEEVLGKKDTLRKEDTLLANAVLNKGGIPHQEETSRKKETKEETSRKEGFSGREEKKRDEGILRKDGPFRREEKRRDEVSHTEGIYLTEEQKHDKEKSRKERVISSEIQRSEETSDKDAVSRKEEAKRREETLRREEVRRKEEAKHREEASRKEEARLKEEAKCKEEALRKEEVRRKEGTECKKEMSRRNGTACKEAAPGPSSNESVNRSIPESAKGIRETSQKQLNGIVDARSVDKNGCGPLKNSTSQVNGLDPETDRQKTNITGTINQNTDSSALQCNFKIRRRTRIELKVIVKTPPGTPGNKDVDTAILKSSLAAPTDKTANEVVKKVRITSTNREGENNAQEVSAPKTTTQVISKKVVNSTRDSLQATNETCKERDKSPRDSHYRNEVPRRDTTKHFNSPNKRSVSDFRCRSRSPPRSNMRENLPPPRPDHSHYRRFKGFRSPPRYRHSRRDEPQFDNLNFSRRSRSLSPRVYLHQQNQKREERFQTSKLPSDRRKREKILFGKSPNKNFPFHRNPPQRPVVVTVNVRRKKTVRLEDSEDSKEPPPPLPKPESLSSTSRLVSTPVDFRERYAEVFSNTGESSDSESGAISSGTESSPSKDSDDSYRPKKRKKVRCDKSKPKSKKQCRDR